MAMSHQKRRVGVGTAWAEFTPGNDGGGYINVGDSNATQTAAHMGLTFAGSQALLQALLAVHQDNLGVAHAQAYVMMQRRTSALEKLATYGYNWRIHPITQTVQLIAEVPAGDTADLTKTLPRVCGSVELFAPDMYTWDVRLVDVAAWEMRRATRGLAFSIAEAVTEASLVIVQACGDLAEKARKALNP